MSSQHPGAVYHLFDSLLLILESSPRENNAQRRYYNQNDAKKEFPLEGKIKFFHDVSSWRVPNPEEIYENVDKLKQIGVDSVSVTKGAGGSLRGGTLPITYFIKNKYKINSIAHFCCRDHTINEIENTMVDYSYFGIKNILALRGDKPDMSDESEWTSDYNYAWQLVRQIKQLNEGKYIPRQGFDKGESLVSGRF